MISRHRVWEGLYRDSVTLMQLATTLAKLEGIHEAFAVMGTPANMDLLRQAGVAVGDIPAKPNDLVLYMSGDSEETIGAALERAADELTAQARETSEREVDVPPSTIHMGMRVLPRANLALISTPGDYAAAEALKAVNEGLHVMLFSDNVSLEDEIRLKRLAHERGLLLMGPDCGTAIINGIPLGFANVVRRGPIGIIGASGTGLQQVTSLIDRWGGGISQAIGTGSHDLHSDVGGTTMLDALDALADDPQTEVIVLVSKPPAPEIARRVLERAGRIGKPIVVDLIGSAAGASHAGNIVLVSTLDEAAARAIALSGGPAASQEITPTPAATLPVVQALGFTEGQRYLRGLFSGGTFSFESTWLLHHTLGTIYSNTPVDRASRLEDVWKSREHTTVDLGDDEFTRGRPHPMIDYRLRVERLLQEARDPEVAVILLDVVLGHGSHPDPVSELVPAIERARQVAEAGGRSLAFVASVCGTERDPQQLSRQEEALRQAGVILGRSNAEAAKLAEQILCQMGAWACAERQLEGQG